MQGGSEGLLGLGVMGSGFMSQALLIQGDFMADWGARDSPFRT
jgi:hypothetical protein